LSQLNQSTLKNRILANLPELEFARFAKSLVRVELAFGEPLQRAGDKIENVYFVEIGLIGSEGVAGASVVLGATTSSSETMCQTGGGGVSRAVRGIPASAPTVSLIRSKGEAGNAAAWGTLRRSSALGSRYMTCLADIKATNETQIVTDRDGRVVETTERQTKPARRGSNFGAGALFGVVVAVGAIAVFACSQGSFRNAGADADRTTAQVQEQVGAAAQNTGDALETAGDSAKQAGEDANVNIQH
jgi:CRP-like cAMP-binding protein